MSNLFDISKFKLLKISGVETVSVAEPIKTHWFKRTEQTFETQLKPFNVTVDESTSLIPKDRCQSYRWDYEGTFPLVSLMYYLTSFKYAYESPIPMMLVNLEGHPAWEVRGNCGYYNICPDLEYPQVGITFSVCKEKTQFKNSAEYYDDICLSLNFKSREQIPKYVTSLEQQDSVIVTKLSA